MGLKFCSTSLAEGSGSGDPAFFHSLFKNLILCVSADA